MADSASGSLPPKLYFRIGEVAGLVGVEPHVLRYWEREFRTIRPTKSAKGQRVYSRRDVESLMRVRELLYEEGFTIAGAKKKLLHPGVDAEVEASPDSPPEAQTAPARAALPTPASGGRAREELLAMRQEIEEFLAQMNPPSDPGK
jgi:DNA-binding transcriptional MerR regulator